MILQNVAIHNEEILEILNGWSDYVLSNKDNIRKSLKLETPPGYYDGGRTLDHWQSDYYKNQILDMGSSHVGFPEVALLFQLKADQLRWTEEATQEFKEQYLETHTKFNTAMMTTLGIRSNALVVAYPENGFIGWHNNCNAPGFNLIFTYSETGDGYWENIDNMTGETERVDDIPGWQCKASYFGHWDEITPDPETKRKIVWHHARTMSCWRLTCSYVFNMDCKEWWEDSIAEIRGD